MQMRVKVGLSFRWSGGSQPVHAGKFANAYCSKSECGAEFNCFLGFVVRAESALAFADGFGL